MHPGGQHHEGSCDHGHYDHGEEFLADAVWCFSMKFLDIEYDLFVSVVVFHRPAAEVETDDLLSFKLAFIEHVGEKNGDFPFGADQPDSSQLNAPGFLPFLGAESRKVVVGRGERDEVLRSAFANESLHGREGGFGGTAEEKVALVVLSQEGDEIEAWVSTIEEQNASGRDKGQERPGVSKGLKGSQRGSKGVKGGRVKGGQISV